VFVNGGVSVTSGVLLGVSVGAAVTVGSGDDVMLGVGVGLIASMTVSCM
jgi:hypothetical protein